MQHRVLCCLLLGMTRAEAASACSIALPTVLSHLNQLYRKTGVHREAALVNWGHEHIDCCVFPRFERDLPRRDV